MYCCDFMQVLLKFWMKFFESSFLSKKLNLQLPSMRKLFYGSFYYNTTKILKFCNPSSHIFFNFRYVVVMNEI